MSETFADTFYFLALLNPKDSAHASARDASRGRVGGLVTTHWVLTEVGDAFALPAHRAKFLALLAELETDPSVVIVPFGRRLFRRGVELYRNRPDKDWPLTDCVSFVVMTDRGIRDALTGDDHFRQAGFIALLK